MSVQPPKSSTLKKYGITQEEWIEKLEGQGGVCAICKQIPKNGRLVTDHEHVRGYKHLPASTRKIYVRGICCLRCNLMYLPVGITPEKAKSVAKYLEIYESKKKLEESQSMPSSVLKKQGE